MVHPSKHRLPWSAESTPLMLAPMQGLTNYGMRSLFAQWVKPDTLFTEFMRVAPGETAKRLSPTDLAEITEAGDEIPLVVQLIGHGVDAMVSAARIASEAGARHVNLNLGCPFGRMNRGLTGGGILQKPELLYDLIPAMRSVTGGSFSVKIRSGYENPEQIFSLLQLFEDSQVDFLVLHPRTVVQEYAGTADHSITALVVRETGIPVIANGDIRTAGDGKRVLEQTGACGLMLGRGAIADPMLFMRLRGEVSVTPDRSERAEMLRYYFSGLLKRYVKIFCGEQQILGKVKTVFAAMDDPDFARQLKALKKARTIADFKELLDTFD